MTATLGNQLVLPALRQDLRLLSGAPDENGAPRWLLFDAMRNTYYTISREGLRLIRHWKQGIPLDDFVRQLTDRGYSYSIEEVVAFVRFAIHNNMVISRNAEGSRFLYRQYSAGVVGFWRWLLHHYLFIRLPLLRPDPWLDRWAPKFSWLYSQPVHIGIMILGATGMILVLRQWDEFLATFISYVNLRGLLLYVLTMAVVKSAHEIGHAVAAWRQGCRVASMGVALLVLLPVLYTDTTDAWRLNSGRKRLRIATAGIRVELYLALLATFLWNNLPDGGLRSGAFFIATTSWLASLSINLSPFMRFDGYYALSDWLGIENLQPRAFEVGRWYLRKILLGLNDPLPEPLPRHRLRIMILYAWGTWIYRLFLFLAIALLVYHFFFKALGVLLFLVEISWFILLPMKTELKTWWARRSDWRLNLPRLLLPAGITAVLVWLTLPFNGHVRVPAVMLAHSYQKYYAPEPSRVAEVLVRLGDSVDQGQLLLRLHSDTLEFERRQLREEISLVTTRLLRFAGSEKDRERRLILERQRQSLDEQAAGVDARLARLEIRASQAGWVTQILPLHDGLWVNTSAPLLSVVDMSRIQIDGYLGGVDITRVSQGLRGTFISDQGESSGVAVTLRAIDVSSSRFLAYEELGSPQGGEIPVRPLGSEHLVPEDSRYRLRFQTLQAEPIAGGRRMPGVVVLEAEPQSWLWHQIRRMLALVIRESGF